MLTSRLGVWKKQHLNLYTGVKTSRLGVWKKQHLNLYTGVKRSGLGVWQKQHLNLYTGEHLCISLNTVSFRHLV
jgi:hypothetical protein